MSFLERKKGEGKKQGFIAFFLKATDTFISIGVSLKGRVWKSWEGGRRVIEGLRGGLAFRGGAGPELCKDGSDRTEIVAKT